jgi:hypothetical protein
MESFIHLVFSPANAIPTALLLFVLAYWVIVILGLIDTDFLDLDIESEHGGEVSADISWINQALYFFNLGRIPLMIWLSFFTVPLWLIMINVTGYLKLSGFIWGILFLFPTAFVCLFIAKIFTMPFIRFFDYINRDTDEKDIIGQLGTVVTSADHIKKGQAEVNLNGNFMLFSILTSPGNVAEKGQRVLFIQALPEHNVFLVEPYTD